MARDGEDVTEASGPSLGTEGAPYELARFIAQNEHLILEVWEHAVGALRAAQPLPRPALLEHVREMLAGIALSLEEVARGRPARSLAPMPAQHAAVRLDEGFGLDEMVAEYSMLRETIERLWEEDEPGRLTRKQIAALDRVIDAAIAVSVNTYTEAKARTLRALDRISATAMTYSDDPDRFLGDLLQVLMDTTDSVDAAAVLLGEGEDLQVRAAVGLDEEVDRRLLLKVGQAIARTRAADPNGVELSGSAVKDVAEGPTLQQPSLQALYTVPLRHDGAPVGVAHMGSRTAFHFPEESKILFRMMASRAATFVAQAEAQALLDTLLAAAPVGIAFIDKNLRYVRINDALAAINGQPAAAHLGRHIRELIPDRAEWIEPTMQKVLRTGTPVLEFEFTTTSPVAPEQTRHFVGNYYPVAGRAGDVLGVGAIVADVTDKKRALEALRYEEQRLRLALDAAQAGLFDDNLVTGACEWTARTKALYGVSPQVPMTRSLAEGAIHPLDRDRVLRAMSAAREPTGGGAYRIEYRTVGVEDCVERWVAARGQCFFDEAGKPVRFIGTVLDITDRRRAEEDLERTAQFREQFMSVLGHDLRNPLGSIQASAALMLKKGNLEQGQSAGLMRIANSAERIGRMISDVLDFARGRLGGGFAVQPERLNMHELCRRVADELHVAHSERELVFEARGDGWGEWDPHRVAQAVSNLVGNAFQHGAPETPVHVRLEDQKEGVLLAIRNWGTPIPDGLLPTMFEPFRGTAVASERAGHKSLGLGLWIAHEIVRAHGGTIDVRSTEKDGTTFSVWWPRVCSAVPTT